MARSMVSFGMFTLRALSTAARNRGLPLMSPPPRRAEIVSSLMTFVQSFDLFESEASFLCLIFVHRLCPDMGIFLPQFRAVPLRASPPAGFDSSRPPDHTPSAPVGGHPYPPSCWPTRRPTRHSSTRPPLPTAGAPARPRWTDRPRPAAYRRAEAPSPPAARGLAPE